MPALAAEGYHVIGSDLRGYGRTDGTGVGYDDDLRPFRMLNEVRDMLSLVAAFGYREVHLAGHDFGSLVASWCAVARPDVFRSVVLMNAPPRPTRRTSRTSAPAAAGAPGAEPGLPPAPKPSSSDSTPGCRCRRVRIRSGNGDCQGSPSLVVLDLEIVPAADPPVRRERHDAVHRYRDSPRPPMAAARAQGPFQPRRVCGPTVPSGGDVYGFALATVAQDVDLPPRLAGRSPTRRPAPGLPA